MTTARFACTALIASTLALAAFAAPQSASAGEREFAESLGSTVLLWNRPSADAHGYHMTDYSVRMDGEFLEIRSEFAWKGFWTENPYDSTCKVTMYLGGAAPRIVSINYDDDCFIPAPRGEHDKLMRILNERLSR